MKRKSALILLASAGALGLAGCETVQEEINEATGPRFNAALTGANEVPAADPDGTGTAKIDIASALNTLCTDLEVRDIGAVTAAHIHRGAAGVNGPPVVTLSAPIDDDDSDDCDVVADAVLDEIVDNPAGFYVNVHTADYPNGAIRPSVSPDLLVRFRRALFGQLDLALLSRVEQVLPHAPGVDAEQNDIHRRDRHRLAGQA